MKAPNLSLPWLILIAAFAILAYADLATAARPTTTNCTVSTDPSPAVISEGGSIQFTGSVSGKPPASYSWSFSGGNPSSSGQQTVTVSYATADSFQVTLQGANDKGQTCQSSVSVTVNPAGGGGNTPPTANANGPYTGTAGAPVSFSSAGSNDPDGSISSYAWDFGDGGSSSAANPSHSYAAAGSYSVSLTVADNNGASDSDSTTCSASHRPGRGPGGRGNRRRPVR